MSGDGSKVFVAAKNGYLHGFDTSDYSQLWVSADIGGNVSRLLD